MSVSQFIGNGIGVLYATDASSNIIMAQANTPDSVRNMRVSGATSAPLAAQRSAVGTITIDACPDAGDITDVIIDSVNQIGGNVAVTPGSTYQTAMDLALAINIFTPGTGQNFTAQVIDNVVYVYSVPAKGSDTNGLSINVSVSILTIQTTQTDFTGGSSQNGIYDVSVGNRFYLNPNSTATLDDLTGATEITEYIVVRGLNSGIISIDKAVSNFVLTGMTRASAFTQIFLDTDGSPTGELAYINPSGFIVGDSIRICQYDASRIVTIEDATISPAPIASKNIYLTDTVPFVCQSNKSIELRLQYDPIFGLVWVENGRSTTQISSVGIQDVIDFNRDLINGNNYQGTGALTANSGINALGLGTNAGYNNQGDNINALGNNAAFGNTGDSVNALGYYAGYNNTGNYVNGIGYQAAQQNTGNFVNGVGIQAAYQNSGTNINAIGNYAASGNTADAVIAIGNTAGQTNSGSYLIALGQGAGAVNTASEVIVMGYSAGSPNSGSELNAMGHFAGSGNSGQGVNAFGYYAAQQNTQPNVNAFGNNAANTNQGTNVNALGVQSAQANTGANVNAMGSLAAYQNTGNNVNVFGQQAGFQNTGGNVNSLGTEAGAGNTGNNANGLGLSALKFNTGESVNGLGYQSGYNNTGDYVNGLGYVAVQSNTGNFVNGLGASAAQANGGNNVNAMGNQAAQQNTGNNVNVFGAAAGYQNTGSNVNAFGAAAGAGNGITGATIISNAFLPSYLNYAAASAAITVGAGASTGCTYLYYDQTTFSIGAVRIP